MKLLLMSKPVSSGASLHIIDQSFLHIAVAEIFTHAVPERKGLFTLIWSATRRDWLFFRPAALSQAHVQ